jgi:hypothetical protein
VKSATYPYGIADETTAERRSTSDKEVSMTKIYQCLILKYGCKHSDLRLVKYGIIRLLVCRLSQVSLSSYSLEEGMDEFCVVCI